MTCLVKSRTIIYALHLFVMQVLKIKFKMFSVKIFPNCVIMIELKLKTYLTHVCKIYILLFTGEILITEIRLTFIYKHQQNIAEGVI